MRIIAGQFKGRRLKTPTWDGVRPPVRRVPPLLGEHSGDVLTWLGYTLDDVRSLRGNGVIQ